MHKLVSKPITKECFEIGDLQNLSMGTTDTTWHIEYILFFLEQLRLKYIETKDMRYWKELVRWLPEGWLQTRTVTMNYENISNMIHQRQNHKLIEWKDDFIDFAHSLPYSDELLFCVKEKNGNNN